MAKLVKYMDLSTRNQKHKRRVNSREKLPQSTIRNANYERRANYNTSIENHLAANVKVERKSPSKNK